MRGAIPSVIVLAAISCGTLFFRLGALPLSGADEPRYARIAEEMRDQRSFVTPLLEGKPWLEKPPLYYWLTASAYSALNINETSARAGPALCALAASFAIFWLGSALWSRQAGLFGAAILLTSIGFIGFGRSASTDMPFTCFLTLSMAMLAAAMRKDIGWKILLAYVFLGFAVLGKGPVALVLAAGICLCAWFLDERGTVIHNWRPLPGLIASAAVFVPWFWQVFRENGFGFISTFFINHNIARYITGVHHHSQPFWYYVPVLLGLVFPWTGWLTLLISKSPISRLRRWREWDPAMLFLVCWFVVPVMFFSLSDSKLAGYVLPSLPPLALILGICISSKIENCEKPRLRTAVFVSFLISVLMAAACPIFFQREYASRETGLFLAAAILIPALVSIGFGIKNKWRHAFATTVLQGIILVLALAQFAFPVLGAYHSTREIARRAIELRGPGEPIVTYRFFHHSLHYYTGYQVTGKVDDGASLLQLARAHPASLVVTNVEGMKQISGMNGIAATPLAGQGDFRLLRVSRSPFPVSR